MKKVKLFEEFLVESLSLIYESKIGDIHIMAGDADSFTAFRKEFMDEYGKPTSVKELKQLEAWLQTIWNERGTNEALSMDAVYIHQITGSGQDSAQNFIDDNNIDSAKLVAYLKQHKDSKEKYDVRDMISGTNKNKRFIKQFVNESKEVFPNEIVGNDQILFKKEWEKMNGGKLAAKYNQYYRGYDIDAGGHIFGSVDELERFMKNYILSNNLYNKYKYMPEKPIGESLKEGTYNNDKEIAIYDGEDGLAYIEKRGKGYYGWNNEFDFEAADKAELEKKLKSWKYKLVSGSID